ncbi:MAG: nuclear transport factor 2 family protein [Cyclobacteriaceae bacterium]|jgi:ketosteroid isomerase-like protein|nr:nuclear transport factor 2 family protein [Cyclobacteriaceae bacterium]
MMSNAPNDNSRIIRNLYTCFQQLDADGMKSCYHDQAQFTDPVFPFLSGDKIGFMWMMLVQTLQKNPGDWKLVFTDVQATAHEGSCTWEATYTFTLTGRRVHNCIRAQFQFQDGKIIRHTDQFDFYRWSRMAFGITGTLLGWMSWFQKKVQRISAHRLAAFQSKHPAKK